MTTKDGSDFIVVANRLPVDKITRPDGSTGWRTSPGGLVTALRPVLLAHEGCWIGWQGTPGTPPAPWTTDHGTRIVPVGLSENDYKDFYEGFSNATLWPLYHDRIVDPVYNEQWWQSYVEVNKRFALATADEAAPGAIVWVQDYQLQLVPGMIKNLREDLTVGFFCHIPFPAPDLLAQLPWRDEIITQLVKADLVGFQLKSSAKNFLDSAATVGGLTVDGDIDSGTAVVHTPDGTCNVADFPISIDTAGVIDIASRSHPADIRARLGNPKLVFLGVDRLDYTKGILERLEAFDELLTNGTLDPTDTVFVQVATPSRERIEHYRLTRTKVERAVGRINGLHSSVGRPVIHYLHRTLDADKLYELYRAADIMVVSAFKDGMNLTAKEYVACHGDGSGALVLSEFAGAASQLTHAYMTNPHNPADLAATMARAADDICHHPQEARRRILADFQHLKTHDVARWAEDFLGHLHPTLCTGS